MFGSKKRTTLLIAGSFSLLLLVATFSLFILGCHRATPEELAEKREIALGYAHRVVLSPKILAISEDGLVSSSGLPDEIAAEVASWRDIVQVAGASFDTVFGLHPDGTVVVATGGGVVGVPTDRSNRSWPYEVSAWEDITQIACNHGGVYGLKKDGTLEGYVNTPPSQISRLCGIKEV